MRAPRLIAFATFVVHAALAGRYDFFRDELYFIVCGRHPAFGYVDQPPLVPLLAAATQLGGERLWLLRVVAGLAHALTVLLAALVAERVGEAVDADPAKPGAPSAVERWPPALAATATALAPMYLGIHTLFGTTTFEPLAWTAIAYLVTDAVVRQRPRSLVWAGLVAGLALECKYALPFYLLPLLAGVLLGRERRILWTWQAAAGLALMAALAAPSAIWQLVHGLPFRQLMAAAGDKNTRIAPLAFAVNQLRVMNPLMAPVWLAGLLATLFWPRFRRVRFLGIGFAGVFVEMIALHGKDYYVGPAYGAMFGAGAVALGLVVRSAWLRVTHVALATALTLVAAPLTLPLLPPPLLARYMKTLPFGPQPQERLARTAPLPQHLADQLGWREFEQSVAAVWRALPPDERARAGVFADNYGEAAALDFYGHADGLPPTLAGHNQYWLWGPRGYDGSVLIVTNSSLDEMRHLCREAHLAGRFGVPLAMPFEHDAPIVVCHGLKPPLPELWPRVKRYM